MVAETSNLTLTDAHGLRVKVPANDRVEVRFPVKTDAAGTARYRVSATDGSDADSATGEFPVYTPVTTEAFATYGVIDNGAIAQPLQTPTGVVPQYGGLEVDTSSTAMQALTDAVVYLDDYPYESADAYASRIIALTSLRRRVRRVRRSRRSDPGAGGRAHQRRHQVAARRCRTATAGSARGPATAIPSRTSASRPPKRSCSRGSPASRCPTAHATGRSRTSATSSRSSRRTGTPRSATR